MNRWTSQDESGRYHLKRIHGYEPKKADLVQRVGAYEDSGFEPAEIKSLYGEWNVNKSALDSCRKQLDDLMTKYGLYHDGMGDAILNLLQAQKEDRLVALPCKVGAKIYGHSGYEITEYTVSVISLATYNWYLRCQNHNSDFWVTDSEIGKTVFLTREEAEAALVTDINVGNKPVTNRNGLERNGHE